MEIVYICKVIISMFYRYLYSLKFSNIYEICYDQPPIYSYQNLPSLGPCCSLRSLPISLFPNILTLSVSLMNNTVSLISTTYIYIYRIITNKERTCHQSSNAKRPPACCGPSRVPPIHVIIFLIVILFLMGITGYTCIKLNILTSENDLCN